jgi:hypothetical protein
MGKDLLVPKDHKVISLENCHCFAGKSDPPPILELGTLPDLQMNVIKTGELAQLELRHTGSHLRINNSNELSLQDGLVSLVVNHGFREKQARDMIEIARENRAQRFLVKYASPPGAVYNLQKTAPSAPYVPEPSIGMDPMTGGKIPTMPLMELSIPIPGMQAMTYDRNVYDPRPEAYSQHHTVKKAYDDESANQNMSPPDQKTMDTAMHAAQSGQKEVFDTAMIGSLLKTVRDDSMIDKYKGDLMKGMDRLARILFMLYWHKDEFEERYGKQDMPELEDGLRNAFEAMGDVVLFLQQKSIEPFPGSEDIDLKSVAE